MCLGQQGKRWTHSDVGPAVHSFGLGITGMRFVHLDKDGWLLSHKERRPSTHTRFKCGIWPACQHLWSAESDGCMCNHMRASNGPSLLDPAPTTSMPVDSAARCVALESTCQYIHLQDADAAHSD